MTGAFADARAAQVVPAPAGRDLSLAVPGATGVGAAYEVTETEQQQATNVLLGLLFTVVETPTHDDRRQTDEDRAARDNAARADDSDTDTAERTDSRVRGYADPE